LIRELYPNSSYTPIPPRSIPGCGFVNFRDVLIQPLPNKRFLVVGCDASGGIGPKGLDVLKVDGMVLGRFIVRTALMEVMSVGAKPLCVACGLGVEPDPTGNRIIHGVKHEMGKIGLRPKVALVVSTQKTFKTRQTGVGMTVVGIAKSKDMIMGRSRGGDIVVSIGLPSVGKEVIENEAKGLIADTDDLLKLLSSDFIHSIIPVGSKGVRYELGVLAIESGLKPILAKSLEVNVKKSAGPSTVLLASLRRSNVNDLRGLLNKPMSKIATLNKP
jgi:hypothetical protein